MEKQKEMTTPQDMEPPPELEQPSILVRLFQRLVGWLIVLACFALGAGFVLFIGLALYRGIIWLMPEAWGAL